VCVQSCRVGRLQRVSPIAGIRRQVTGPAALRTVVTIRPLHVKDVPVLTPQRAVQSED
jgi:hypothetical protein